MAYFDLILNTGKIFSPHYMREREKSDFLDQGSYPQQEQEQEQKQEVQLQLIVDRFSILKSVKKLTYIGIIDNSN